jgi:hypothetical protein
MILTGRLHSEQSESPLEVHPCFRIRATPLGIQRGVPTIEACAFYLAALLEMHGQLGSDLWRPIAP